MSPDGGGVPEGALAEAINGAFGDTAALVEQVIDAGVKRFGSGWSWLVVDGGTLSRHLDAEPGHPAERGQDADPRHRRLGARLLPEVPEPAPRVPRRLVERRQLGGGRPALRDGGLNPAS